MNFSTGGTIQGLKISSDALSAIVLSNNSQQQTSSIKKVDFATGEVSTLLQSGQTSTQIATGRFDDIYILQSGASTLSRFTSDSPKPISIPLPESMTAITYDDFTDTVLLFAQQTRRLYRYQKDFAPGGVPTPHEIFQLPPDLPTSGARFLTVSPVTGHVWYSTNQSSIFWEIIIPGDGSVIVNPVSAPSSLFSNDLTIDDEGYMYFCDAGFNILRMYAPHKPGEDSLTLLGPEDHPLAGSPCRLRFAIAVSRNNFDPATANDPAEWDIVLPTEFTPSIPGCPADLDGNGVVNVSDMLLLFDEWGTTAGFADVDLNFDGFVNVSDLLLLFNAWGPCP